MLLSRYYERHTILVATDLLGKILVVQSRGIRLTGKIVETEAYFGQDPASHSRHGRYLKNGKERRCAQMFEPPGRAYVYAAHRGRPMLNVVARSAEFDAGAVLIRAIEPLEGVAQMERKREAEGVALSNGPAKLCEALGITLLDNGALLTGPRFWIEANSESAGVIHSSPRIGISEGTNLHWRFFLQGNTFVSPHPMNKKSRLWVGINSAVR